MKKIGFRQLSIILVSGLLFLFAARVFAQVKVSVTIPGPNGTGTGIGGFIDNFYRFSLMIGGVLAFGAVVYGGIKYIFAAGNPSGQSEGRDWITGAIWGLLLLAGAYLLLNVINPNLTNLALPTLTAVQQVQGTSGSGCTGACGSGPNLTCFGTCPSGQTCAQDNSGAAGIYRCVNSAVAGACSAQNPGGTCPSSGQTCTKNSDGSYSCVTGGKPAVCGSISKGCMYVGLGSSQTSCSGHNDTTYDPTCNSPSPASCYKEYKCSQ